MLFSHSVSSLQASLSQGDVDRIVDCVSKRFHKDFHSSHRGSKYESKPNKHRKVNYYGPDSGEESEEYDSESDYTDDFYSEEGSSDEEFDDYVPSKPGVVSNVTNDAVVTRGTPAATTTAADGATKPTPTPQPLPLSTIC